MWKLTTQPKTQLASKRLVQEFVNMDACPRDRPLSERRLDVYRKIIEDGGFRPVSWACTTCGETGGTYRVNGKHTSILLSQLDPLPELYVVVERYHCDTLEDVARLYATYDSRTQSRNASDINMSFAGTVSALALVRKNIINSCVSGMGYCIWGPQTYTDHSISEKAELLLEHYDFVVWVGETLSYSPDRKATDRNGNRHLIRQPVIAAMFGCYQKAKTAANTFWSAVRDETGATPNCPDRKISRFLLSTNLDRGGVNAVKDKTASVRSMYVKCIKAWNAWRKGEETDLKYYADKEIPTYK